MAEEDSINIRDMLGFAIDRRIVDVSQHDPGEDPFIMIMLDNATWIKLVPSIFGTFVLIVHDGDTPPGQITGDSDGHSK